MSDNEQSAAMLCDLESRSESSVRRYFTRGVKRNPHSVPANAERQRNDALKASH